jgi:hypothetical protein
MPRWVLLLEFEFIINLGSQIFRVTVIEFMDRPVVVEFG